MKKSVIVVVLLCLITSLNQLVAQDTLLLMNGHLVSCKIVADTGTVFQFEMMKRNGKIKSREVHKSEVFSVKKSGQAEQVLYAQDAMLGDDLTIEEMKFYIAGETDARNNYNALPVFIVGLAACGAIAYIGGDGYITAFAPPVIYILVQLIGRVKVQEGSMSNPNYEQNDMYAYGYGPVARSRKFIRATEGGFAGSALGVTLYFLLNK